VWKNIDIRYNRNRYQAALQKLYRKIQTIVTGVDLNLRESQSLKKLKNIRKKRLSKKLVKEKPLISGSPPRQACEAGIEAKQIYLPVTVKRIQIRAFIDSGATFNIISLKIIQRLGITPQKITEILPTFLFDRTRVADITHKIEKI
jgi:hypothetical protein